MQSDDNQRGPSLAWARIAVALLGVLLVAIGIRAAWRSDAATAPLVLGALLVVVALVFSRDLEELSWRWRDMLFTVKQRPPPGAVALGELAEELFEVVNRELPPGDEKAQALRGRLAELANKAREAEEEAYASAWQPDPRFTGWAYSLGSRLRDGLWVEGDLEPTYSLVRSSPAEDDETRITEGEVSIAIYFRWWGDWVIALRVTDPDEIVSQGLLYGNQYMQGNNFVGNYPGEWIEAPPIEPGEYVFEWCRALGPDTDLQPGYVLRRDCLTISRELLDQTPYAVGLEPVRDEVPSEWDQKMGLTHAGQVAGEEPPEDE